MRKNFVKFFVFKKELIDYIADYYSSIGECLNDYEYDELKELCFSFDETELLGFKKVFGFFKNFELFKTVDDIWGFRFIC